MIITYEKLEKAKPYGDWLQWFKKNVGEQTADFEWNPASQGLLLADKKLRRNFGWLVRNRFLPMYSMADLDLRRANLTGADLRGADLYRADLTGAILHRADLRWANLTEANLRWANLYWADLREANLYRADLSWANLYGGNLREANLIGADLRGADLTGANLYWADLREAKHNKNTRWPKGSKAYQAAEDEFSAKLAP